MSDRVLSRHFFDIGGVPMAKALLAIRVMPMPQASGKPLQTGCNTTSEIRTVA
jgi:hypothetical protein